MTDYRPGDVSAVPGAVPPVLVGSQPLWGDDSDASYSEHTTDPGSMFSTAARAEFDPVPTGTYQLLVRFERVSGLLNRLGVGLHDSASSETAYSNASNSEFQTDTSGVIEWQESSPFALSAVVAASPVVDLSTTSTDVSTFRGYEVILRGVGSQSAPPLRLFPRTDRLGNTPRIFPPPITRQGSIRPTGHL